MKGSTVLYLSAGYWALCALSAILWPSSWHIVAGLPPRPLDISLAVAGAMMGGLAILSFASAHKAESYPPVLAALATANALDALVVLFYSAAGQIPSARAALFILIDLVWLYCLLRVKRSEVQA